MDAPEDPPGQVPTDDGGAENKDKSADQAANEVERASRQSTPLSELSSAPETAPDDENGAADGSSNATDGDVGSKDAAKGQANGAFSTSTVYARSGIGLITRRCSLHVDKRTPVTKRLEFISESHTHCHRERIDREPR